WDALSVSHSPLSFLGRLKPFFSFWQRKKRTVSKMRADEYPQGAGRICNAPSSRTAALGIGPYKRERSAAEDRGP
ncbi:MAG: hypothetical protein J6L72_00260, partial [Butyricicoccus sp.]|nr:hypothetical protein [Butyricicoccus sp.]